MSVLNIIVESIWFFMPAIVANMAPVFAAHYHWLPRLNQPVDGGLVFAGQRLFGATKTIRGFLVGVAAGAWVGLVQSFLFHATAWAPALSLVSYGQLEAAVFLGAILGFGALLGDIFKSFLKRRLGMVTGGSWLVFDQIDFVIGATAVTWWLVPLSAAHIITALLVIGAGSFLTSLVGVQTGIKKSL
jgi:CDP-2,3-bis-(O-geranylgeranyl)-sn-glycerol synthase